MWSPARPAQADRNLENDISRLAEELSADDTPGAAYCSFENFRQIYHLQRGVQSRFGVPVYLALPHHVARPER